MLFSQFSSVKRCPPNRVLSGQTAPPSGEGSGAILEDERVNVLGCKHSAVHFRVAAAIDPLGHLSGKERQRYNEKIALIGCDPYKIPKAELSADKDFYPSFIRT